MNKSAKYITIVVLLAIIGGFSFGTYQKNTPSPIVQEIVKDSISAYEKLDSFDLSAVDKYSYALGVLQTEGLEHYIDSAMNVSKDMLPYFYAGLSKAFEAYNNKTMMSYVGGLSMGYTASGIINTLSKENLGEEICRKEYAEQYLRGLLSVNPKYNADEATSTAMECKERLMEKLYSKNKADGERFIEQKSKEAGVNKLPGGTLYKVIKSGNGKTPTKNQTVLVQYVGKLIDGTEIDNSDKYDSNGLELPVGQVIPGWTEALTRMQVGSEWELYIPYDQAYGGRETGPIMPYSALVFTVKLIAIK